MSCVTYPQVIDLCHAVLSFTLSWRMTNPVGKYLCLVLMQTSTWIAVLQHIKRAAFRT